MVVRKRKSHLFGGRKLSDTKDVLERKFVDGFAVVEHHAVKIALLISVSGISNDYRFCLGVKMHSDFHDILLA